MVFGFGGRRRRGLFLHQHAGRGGGHTGEHPGSDRHRRHYFQEGSSQYWNAANTSVNGSAISYIPEVVWNDSAQDGEPSASGGGNSQYFTRPAWQTGAGVPGDNARHVPDVSMNASADHDGYLVYTQGADQVFGGTSVPTPVYAGLAALLNQYLTERGVQSSPGLGNINPTLYSLAQTAPGIFHDITSGDNVVTARCPRARDSARPDRWGTAPGRVTTWPPGWGRSMRNNW